MAPPDEAVDWNRAYAVAHANGVAPAVARAVHTAPVGMPRMVRNRFERDLVDAKARRVLLDVELARLLKEFSRESIPVIPLKGPVLAEALYREPSLRPCTDLDLLVQRHDVARVDGVLRRLGHRRRGDAHSYAFDVVYDHATLYQAPSGVHVDLHWGLLSDPRYWWNEMEAASVWNRAVPIRVAGEDALGLCPTDLLLYLTLHLAVHHGLAGLLWCYDLSLLLARGLSADPSAVSERAARWRVRSAVYFALREVEALFGVTAPTALMRRLRPHGPRAAGLEWLLRYRGMHERHAIEHVIALLLVDRGRDVVCALSRIVLPSVGWVEARYGDAASSRLGYYRAHYRRLGEVLMGALRGVR